VLVPVSARTRVVLPWSMCPAVPMIMVSGGWKVWVILVNTIAARA
jgi:hypothetical protein